MKGAIFAGAAAFVGAASARKHAHAKAHEVFARGASNDTAVCVPGCTTIWKTVVGEPTWVPHNPPPPPVTSTLSLPIPTPEVTICPTTGVYTIPAKTVIITETTTACAAQTTILKEGSSTYGGVVTVVDKQTVVTCPYAAQETTNGVVTEVVKSTVITCPSAGTYTVVPPTTTTVAKKDVTVVVQVVTTYCPGTYTAPSTVVTATVTNSVYVCPLVLSTTTVVAPTPTPEAPKVEAPKEEVKVKVEETKKVEETSSKKVEVSTSKIVAEGQFITYTAYESNGDCKSQSEVTKDMTIIKGMGMSGVRIYSTDCNMIETVSTACLSVGLRMDIGIFINQPGCNNANPDVASQIATIKEFVSGKGKDLVRYMVVGNEAVFGGFCTPGQLSSLIVQVKKVLVEAGCGALVTTTETTNIWEQSDFRNAIVPVCDIIGLNAHAYFNAQVSSSGAGKFVVGQIDVVKGITGKEVCVFEAGWPGAGPDNGDAHATPEDQKTAIKSIINTCGNQCVIFTFGRDGVKDMWKHSELEQSFTVSPSCLS